jgi:hypothetical protein
MQSMTYGGTRYGVRLNAGIEERKLGSKRSERIWISSKMSAFLRKLVFLSRRKDTQKAHYAAAQRPAFFYLNFMD